VKNESKEKSESSGSITSRSDSPVVFSLSTISEYVDSSEEDKVDIKMKKSSVNVLKDKLSIVNSKPVQTVMDGRKVNDIEEIKDDKEIEA